MENQEKEKKQIENLSNNAIDDIIANGDQEKVVKAGLICIVSECAEKIINLVSHQAGTKMQIESIINNNIFYDNSVQANRKIVSEYAEKIVNLHSSDFVFLDASHVTTPPAKEAEKVLEILEQLRSFRNQYPFGSQVRTKYNAACDKIDILASHLRHSSDTVTEFKKSGLLKQPYPELQSRILILEFMGYKRTEKENGEPTFTHETFLNKGDVLWASKYLNSFDELMEAWMKFYRLEFKSPYPQGHYRICEHIKNAIHNGNLDLAIEELAAGVMWYNAIDESKTA